MRRQSIYYADLNPAYGVRGEKRYAVFHRRAGILHNYKYGTMAAAREAADRFNKRLMELERELRSGKFVSR